MTRRTSTQILPPIDDSGVRSVTRAAAEHGSRALLRAQLIAGQHFLSDEEFHAAVARLNARSNVR